MSVVAQCCRNIITINEASKVSKLIVPVLLPFLALSLSLFFSSSHETHHSRIYEKPETLSPDRELSDKGTTNKKKESDTLSYICALKNL